MKIERIITEGELLNVEQLAEIAGGTGVQVNNTNNGICKCPIEVNSNSFICHCINDYDGDNKPNLGKPTVNPSAGGGK